MPIVTRHVLDGAYRGRASRRAILSHSVDAERPDSTPALCGQENLCDYEEHEDAPPTCPRCLAKDSRFNAPTTLIPNLIMMRIARTTGTRVSVYRTGGVYIIACDEHGCDLQLREFALLSSARQLRIVRARVADPCEWCTGCRRMQRPTP